MPHDAEYRQGSHEIATAASDDVALLAERAAQYARKADYSNGAVAANEAVLDVEPDNVDALLRLLRSRLERSEYVAALAISDRLRALSLEDDDEAFAERWRSAAEAGRARVREGERREDRTSTRTRDVTCIG